MLVDLSVGELLAVARLPHDEREHLMALFVRDRQPWLPKEEIEAIDRVTERLRSFRARLRAKRRGGYARE